MYTKNPGCIPMTRVYYLHYQWFPLYMATLGIFFYFPYIIFSIANRDVNKLKEDIKDGTDDVGGIVKNYFSYSVTSKYQMRIRILWHILIKVLYLLSGCTTFYLTDYVFLGRYLTYGLDYIKWQGQNNTLTYIGISKSSQANAGELSVHYLLECQTLHTVQHYIRHKKWLSK